MQSLVVPQETSKWTYARKKTGPYYLSPFENFLPSPHLLYCPSLRNAFGWTAYAQQIKQY